MRNSFVIEGDTIKIQIVRKNGETFEVLVSIEDLDKVDIPDISWCLYDGRKNRGGLYAYYRVPLSKPQINKTMHRLLAGAKSEDLVDHVNGNTLDNRRQNLRIATTLENNHNRTRVNGNNTSGFPGVAWHSQQNKWRAYIMIDHHQKHLGCFETKEEAAEAARNARATLFPFSKDAREVAELRVAA
jgi:hypothetical protein